MSAPLLTPADLQARYQLPSVDAVYTMRYRGELPPAIKVGRSLRWRLSTVEKWEQRNEERVA